MPERTRILVTDDAPDVLLLTAMVLEDEGYEVFKATSGEECLEIARSQRPDIVLLDVMLPDMSGTEVCKQIKEDEDLEGTFVILVSGVRVSPDYQADGLNVGADGYVIKPITNRELIARVQAVARIKRAEDALREKKREQQKLIVELQEALAEIRTLKGFIPICASCKKIRDDEGYWNQLEAYISKHTDAIFTHSICPQCAEKYKADIRETLK
ncbi:MAG TPA: response regulator [Syntrophorhabdales bacterium]|nr:response regulator [Syntrophorhabdales bacterium]